MEADMQAVRKLGRSGEASPLWLEAHAACNGSRDEMWDWLEARYHELDRIVDEKIATIGELVMREQRNTTTEGGTKCLDG